MRNATRWTSFVVAMVTLAGSTVIVQMKSVKYRPELVVQIPVANLDRSIAFYTQTLGYKLTERRDDLAFAHIDTNVPGLQFGLNQVEKPNGSGGVILNIGVADAAEARKTLEARGVIFNGPTRIIPGKVALASFTDPDGNRLTFAGLPPPAKK